MLAQYYEYIYLAIVTIWTLVEIQNKKPVRYKEPLLSSGILCAFMVLLIGFRPHSYLFGDTINYAKWWASVPWEGFQWSASNLIFDNLYDWMGSIFPNATFLFVIISAIYYVCIFFTCKKLFPNHILLSFLVWLGAFSTYSYGVNGIKAGAAASLFITALAYRDNKWLSGVLVLLSWGFHHSMQLPVGAYVLTVFFKNTKWYLYGWVFCLLMALSHVTIFQEIFSNMSDEAGARYISGAHESVEETIKGFRLDFVLYSTMPIVMGYYVIFIYKLHDWLYESILNIYLTCNGVWMLCMYASFTNRIAYLSWFLYPFLIIYPCFCISNINHPLVAHRNTFILCHLGFTLFMNLIYY